MHKGQKVRNKSSQQHGNTHSDITSAGNVHELFVCTGHFLEQTPADRARREHKGRYKTQQ